MTPYDRKMPSANAEGLLVVLMRKHLGVEVDRARLRAFLRGHMAKVSPLAHAIHDAPEEPKLVPTAPAHEHESYPYEFVERQFIASGGTIGPATHMSVPRRGPRRGGNDA